jgi:hypothetical protein
MSCVYCGSVINLNTTFNITIDENEKVQVFICDEHAEDASVKTAKEAYGKKQKQIDDFLAQAKALGLDITVNDSSKLSVVTDSRRPEQLVQPVTRQVVALFDDSSMVGDDVVNTDMIDNNRSIRSVGGSTDYGSVDSYNSLDRNSLSDKLDPSFFRGKAKITMVEGRDGQPIAIPEHRVDGTGSTRIKIIKTEDDQRLQTRFKKMADDSKGGKTPDFARSGYQNTMKMCPLCRGDCTIKNDGQTMVCPKCNGSGMISVY